MSKFFAKSDSKGAVHAYVGKVVGVARHVIQKKCFSNALRHTLVVLEMH